jgi:hypothetical protein
MLKESKMYIIKNSPNDYEGTSEVVAYTQDITKANAHVDKMNAFLIRVKAARDLRNKHQFNFIRINPMPTIMSLEYVDPRAQYLLWKSKRKDHMELFDLTLDLIMQKALKDDVDRTCYDVEEIPELE